MNMENELEKYRRLHDLTYRCMAKMCENISLYSVFSHCHGKNVSAEFALLYERILGIPRWKIRPDIWDVPTLTEAPDA